MTMRTITESYIAGMRLARAKTDAPISRDPIDVVGQGEDSLPLRGARVLGESLLRFLGTQMRLLHEKASQVYLDSFLNRKHRIACRSVRHGGSPSVGGVDSPTVGESGTRGEVA